MSAEFNVSALLKADATQFVAGIKEAAAANTELSASARATAAAMDVEQTASIALGFAQMKLAESAEATTLAHSGFGGTLKGLLGSVGNVIPAIGSLAEGMGASTAATGAAEAGALGLSGALSGGLTIAITAGIGLLGGLISGLSGTADAADDAVKGLDAFERKQLDLNSFIDASTGKLREQARALAEVAAAGAQATINTTYGQAQTTRAGLFDAANARLVSAGASRSGSNDVELSRAILNANGNAETLAKSLDALVAKGRTDLTTLANQANVAATAMIGFRQTVQTAQATQSGLNTALHGGTVESAALIEHQVALSTATGAVAKAQQHFDEVRRQGENIKNLPIAEQAAAYAQFKTDLTEATRAVQAAQQSQRDARDAAHDHAVGLRDAAAAAREAEAADKAQDAALVQLIGTYDPGAATIAKMKESVTLLSDAYAAGKLPLDEYLKLSINLNNALAESQHNLLTQQLGDPGKQLDDALANDPALSHAATDFGDKLTEGAKRAAEQFRRDGEDAARSIADLIGGKAGGAIGKITGLFGGRTGAGAIDRFLNDLTPSDPLKFADGRTPADVRESGIPESGPISLSDTSVSDLGQHFHTALQEFLGGDSTLSKSLRTGLSGIAEGLAASGLVGSGTGNKIGGAIGGALGKAFGTDVVKQGLTAISSKLSGLAGPLAGALGGLAGSLIGGLFQKVKKGTATVTSIDGANAISGNSASYEAAAGKLGGTLQSSLSSIIDQLGGVAGDFSVSIGQRKKKFVVDTSGSGLTKGAGVQKYSDADSAEAAALADAIADGAVKGLSPAVSAALRSSSDVTKAVSEALAVQNLETALDGLKGTMDAELKTFETTAEKRVELARKYGLDETKVTELNEKERAAAIQSAIDEQLGGLKDLQTSLTSGDLFEGTAADKIKALDTDIKSALGDLAAGVSGAGDRLSQDYEDRLSTAKDAYGTAGPEYAGILLDTKNSVAAAVAAQTKAANDADAAVQQQLGLSQEANDLAATTNAKLDQVVGAIGSLAGALGGRGDVGTIVTSTARRLSA